MLLRGLSEFYAALILLIASIAIAPKIVELVKASYPDTSTDYGRPILVARINETHALCYTATVWEPSRTREIISSYSFWLYTSDLDGDGLLDPTPGDYNSVVKPGVYVLVSPPIVCRR